MGEQWVGVEERSHTQEVLKPTGCAPSRFRPIADNLAYSTCSLEECYANNLGISQACRIFPTPVLMVVSNRDSVVPSDIALQCYAKLSEPKELLIVDGDHFDALDSCLDEAVNKQVNFLRGTLCK